MNGWGPLSDTALLQAATVPSTPQAPVYYPNNSNSTQIYIGFVPPSDNGGAEISNYLLYSVVDSISTSQTQTLVYSGTSLFSSVDSTTYSLVAGTTYRFTLKAVNKFGASGESQYVLAALGKYPDQPSAPTKVESESTQTSITIAWTESTAVYSTPITGYKVYGDAGTGGKFTVLYDGSSIPNVLTHTFGGLTTGLAYQYAITALNINGESAQSTSAVIYACNVPSNFILPTKIATSKTSITIGWNAPESNGCPIQSYSIFKDDGSGGAITNEVDASSVNNQPSLRQYTISSLSPTGATFRFKITATNAAGSASSTPVSIVLASVPDTPSVGPTSDASVTNESVVKALITPLLSASSGGSIILSYSLEMDDGKGGSFTEIPCGTTYCLNTAYTIKSGITSGTIYRFRYRALNIAGWSDYSPITNIKAATRPARPPAPVFVTADATSITLNILPSTSIGGSPIIKYELWVNGGGSSGTFSNVSSFSGKQGLAVITTTDGLVAGQIYTFMQRAVNEIDSSDYSDTVVAGVSDFPDQPTTLSVSSIDSTSITLEWGISSDKELPVIGYQLEIDDGYGGDFEVLYNGYNFPNVRQYTATGLTRGLEYKFQLKALNFNGPGAASNSLTTYFCSAPSGLDPPTLLSSTSLTLTLTWNPPADDGGCPVLEYILKRDDGSGSTAPINTIVDQTDFQGEPSLREHTVTFSSADTSKSFKFQLYAQAVSLVSSDPVTFVVAAKPNAPEFAPTEDNTQTTSYQISVVYLALPATSNGGSDITSYELQMYLVSNSSWVSLVGGNSPSLTNTYIASQNISQGVTYSFRYRAYNVNGAGDFSPIGYLLAAQRPSQPSAPVYITSDDTSITLGFIPPASNGGSMITSYILQYSDYATLNWMNDTTYTDNSMTHKIDSTSSLFTAHQKYRFRIYCANIFGNSDYSDEIALSIASLPSQLAAPTKDQSSSSQTSISIIWTAPSDVEPIIGYLVYMADISSGGSYTLIYDGSSNPIRLTYKASLLTPGKSYGFKVQAINFNGKGPLGVEAIFES